MENGIDAPSKESQDSEGSKEEMSRQARIKSSSVQDRYLTFEIDSEYYGVEILSVKEIIGLQKTIPVPRTPEYVKGVMNLRGVIIPVISLRNKLKMEEIEPQMDTAIVIVNIHSISVGFVVDRVNEVASITEENLSTPPEFGSKIDTDFIKQMGKIERDVVMILDLEKIFDSEELSGISNLQKKTQ